MVWLTVLVGAALIFLGIVSLLIIRQPLWLLLSLGLIFIGIILVVVPGMIWRNANPDEPFPTPAPAPNPQPYSVMPGAQRGSKLVPASGTVIATVISEDGKYLFVATSGNAVDVYRDNTNTWQYINSIVTSTSVSTWVDCSANGEWLVVGNSMATAPSGSGVVSVWRTTNYSTWQSQVTVTAGSATEVLGRRVAWSENGVFYTTATGVGVLRLNSDNSWLQTHITIPSNYGAPRGLGVSANGAVIAVGTTQSGDRGVILVYRNQALEHTLFEPVLGSGGEYNYGRQLALSSTGSVLVTTTGTSTIVPYNVLPYTGRVLLYQLSGNIYNAITLEPPVTQTVKVTVGDGRARTLDLTHEGKVLAVSVSEDANGAGGVAIYRLEGTNWVYRGTRRPADASTTSGNAGSALTISGNGTLVVSDETELVLWTFK